MTKQTKLLLFPLILVSYALLYLATSVDDKEYPCDERCLKERSVMTELRKRVYVKGGVGQQDSTFIIMVNDSAAQNWKALADTGCIYLKVYNLPYKTVHVYNIQNPQSKLATTSCP